MNENDLRVVKSRANICNTFMELLKEKPLQEINVKEICDRAMISRNTFYMHFPYKESVLEYLNKQCADVVLSGLSDKVDCIGENSTDTIWNYTKNIIRETAKGRDLLTFLTQYDKNNLSATLTDSIYDFFITAAKTFTAGDISIDYEFACKYISAGLVNFLIYWMEHPEISDIKAQEMLYSIHGKAVEAAASALQQ